MQRKLAGESVSDVISERRIWKTTGVSKQDGLEDRLEDLLEPRCRSPVATPAII